MESLLHDSRRGRDGGPAQQANLPVNNLAYQPSALKQAQQVCWVILAFLVVLYISFMTETTEADKKHAAALSNPSTLTSPGIQKISLVGEWHIGYDWFQDTLTRCFPNLTISSSGFDDRPGYLLQDPPKDDEELSSLEPNSTLLVALFSNPYESMESYRTQYPYAPAHKLRNGSNMAWQKFVQQKWTMHRPAKDKNLTQQERVTPGICQYGFDYGRIISCTGDGDGLYEHDRTGTPFDSILDLRAERIRNVIQQIPKEHVDVAPQTLPVSADIAFETKGSRMDGTPLFQTQLLDPIAKVTGIPFDCTPSAIRGIEPAYQPLEQEYVNWINVHVDWSTEAMIKQKKQTWEDLKGLHSASEENDSKSEDDSEEEPDGGEDKKGASKNDSSENKNADQANDDIESSSNSSNASTTKGDSGVEKHTHYNGDSETDADSSTKKKNETSTADESGKGESAESESENEIDAKDKENNDAPHESDSEVAKTKGGKKSTTPKKTGSAKGGDKTGASDADTEKSDSNGTDKISSVTKKTDDAPTTNKSDGQETDIKHTKADSGDKQKSGGSTAKVNKGTLESEGKKEKSHHHHTNSPAAPGSGRERKLFYGAGL